MDLNWLSQLVTTHLFLAIGGLLMFIFAAWVMQQERPASTSLAWIITILTLPYIGIPLFLLIGSRKLSKKHHIKPRLYQTQQPGDDTSSSISRLPGIMNFYGLPPFLKGHEAEFHTDGEYALERLNKLIENARERIDLCLFMLHTDTVGACIIRALIRSARRGISTRILLDGVGSMGFSTQWTAQLRKEGIQIAWFIPVFHRPLKGRTNLRNHRKLLIVDSRYAWCGGRNISQEYFDKWIDLSCDLSGPHVTTLQYIFDCDWNFATDTPPPDSIMYPPPNTSKNDGELCVIPSGPDISGDPLHAILITACFEANSDITLITPYFVPDETLLVALRLACERGVQVKILVPNNSNHKLADLARNRYLRTLMDSGAKVFVYTGGMLHAKLYVIDEMYAFMGSANLDIRSLYLNFEIMLLYTSREDIQSLRNWARALEAELEPYTMKQTKLFQRLLEGVVTLLSFQL